MSDDTRAVVALIEQFNDAFNRHDVDTIMVMMTDDCRFENTFPAPDGELHQGQETVRAFWQAFFDGSPHAQFEIEEVFASADRGVMRWRYSWIGQDGLPGHVRGVDIFRLKGGKIAEKLSYVKG